MSAGVQMIDLTEEERIVLRDLLYHKANSLRLRMQMVDEKEEKGKILQDVMLAETLFIKLCR